MKQKKGAKVKKIGLVAVALVLALGVMSAGMAYFSQQEAVAISMTAGTPDLQLSIDNGSTWGDGASATWPTDWAPGDNYTLEVWTKNVGNSGLWALYVTGNNLGGTGNLCDVIEITDVAYTDTCGWVHPAGGTYYDGVFGNQSAPLTLRELADGQTDGHSMAFCWGDCATEGDYLPANSGRIQKFLIEFTFNSAAGNEYQGTTASFDLLFLGSDDPFTPVWIP
jgi:hypothetical protein